MKNIEIDETVSAWRKFVEKVKDFFIDHLEQVIGISVVALFTILTLFVVVPVKETAKVTATWWDWQIPINKFSVVTHTSSTYPRGADVYDIHEEHKRHTKTVTDEGAYTDSDGHHHPARTHTETYYTTEYHYKRNEWVFSYNVPASGTDHEPHEAECSIPWTIENPQLGELTRGSVVETYGVMGTNEGGEGVNYDVSKEDWERIEKGGTISYKRHRFKDNIYDITFN